MITNIMATSISTEKQGVYLMNKANEITIKLNEEEFNSIREFAKSKSLEIEEAVKMTVLELIEEEKTDERRSG